MSLVVWWTCALLTVAAARIYERCELARELQRLGIGKEQIPTWVCIAFHESRYDTAALNPGSGDHGLLQISELYWCGPGKVCGVPCSAFRDDDIKDDVECALQIHEEHTRLQGDGFLAWVVYPLYCKHTTKKFIADCDIAIKNGTQKYIGKQRGRTYDNFAYSQKSVGPSYLTINSFLRQNAPAYTSLLPGSNWLNHKIENIDELKLPVFNKTPTTPAALTLAKTNTPTTTTTIPTTTPTLLTRPADYIMSLYTPKVRLENVFNHKTNTLLGAKNTSADALIQTTSLFPSSFSSTYQPARTSSKSYFTTPKPKGSSTIKPFSLKPLTTLKSIVTSFTTTRTPSLSTSQFSHSTQSIFDLYLHPTTRRPAVELYKPSSQKGRYVLKIFSDGTTAAPKLLISATQNRLHEMKPLNT